MVAPVNHIVVQDSQPRDNFVGCMPRDFFNAFCGDRINAGTARCVYEYAVDDTRVVKIEEKVRSFQNVFEWDIWMWAKDYPIGKWLAPCHYISPAGIVLIQERTKPLPPDYKLPKKLPAIFGDLKPDNFGLLKGKLVCHDYGTAPITMQNDPKVRLAMAALKRAEWVRIEKT